MARVIKNFFVMFTETLQFPSDLFSTGPGVRRYTDPIRTYLTNEEAWRQDWANIGNDFRRSYDRLSGEIHNTRTATVA